MKICWDNLENIEFTKFGNFKFAGDVYIEEGSCKQCGEPFLRLKYRKQEYCCKSCSRIGKKFSKQHRENIKLSKQNISKETRKKMSDARKGKKLTKAHKANIGKHNKGELNYFYKGGVKKKGLPLYDTYSHQINWVEETKPCYKDGLKLLKVRCTNCNKWFVPKLNNVKDRLKFLKGSCTAEALFYCSDSCKEACPVFWKIKYPAGHNPNKLGSSYDAYTDQELSIWSKEVLKRAKNRCEICGKKAEHAHHIEPKKLAPGLALDPENGLALCKNCHYKYGHADRCSTGNLAVTVCK